MHLHIVTANDAQGFPWILTSALVLASPGAYSSPALHFLPDLPWACQAVPSITLPITVWASGESSLSVINPHLGFSTCLWKSTVKLFSYSHWFIKYNVVAPLGAASGSHWTQKLAMYSNTCYSHSWYQSDSPLPHKQVQSARYLRHSGLPHILLLLTKGLGLSREVLGGFTMAYLGQCLL